MCLVNAVALFLSLCALVPGYRVNRDDDGNARSLLNRDYRLNVSEEQELFRNSGACSASDYAELRTCDPEQSGVVRTLYELKNSSCFCDGRCADYRDCCINRASANSASWNCREVRGENVSRIPIYVHQQCPRSWDDPDVRDMCEVESTIREQQKLSFSHLQDLPVMSDESRRWYRNVFCAVCNKDTRLVKWSTYMYCNGDSEKLVNSLEEDLDFSSAVYVPRTMNFRRVKVGDKQKSCQIIVRDFNLKRILSYGARLCKPAVSSCPDGVGDVISEKCAAYTSYVYSKVYANARREVYGNFHCALCNGVVVEDLSCVDPYSPVQYGTPWSGAGKSSLSLLFDFNFNGGWEDIGSLDPCHLSDGQLWDPIFKRCRNFTCGNLYERIGSKCVPLNKTGDDVDGIESDCVKVPLDNDAFYMFPNGTIYVNESRKFLSRRDYEVHRTNGKEDTQIIVCLDDETNLLPSKKLHSWLSIITLSISITCLILHLLVYSLLKSLRNCPGKILMSLSASLLCGHVFLLLGSQFSTIHWLCYVSSVTTHFGYISAFSWMSVMAYDIHGTFSVTKSRSSKKSVVFLKYSLYAWTASLSVVILSVVLDNTLQSDNRFRPKYGDPICWFNHRKGLLLFFVVPAAALLFTNLVLFVITAVHIRKVSLQTKMVNNFSDKVRYFLYLKLSIVLGLTWILGLIAGITRLNAFWYPFIILNGLQGALIFVSFTIKRNILKMLAVKLRIRSDKYSIGKRRGIRAAMYSSLSNLTTMQTSLTSQIAVPATSTDMLKAVRKINPDAITIESKKT